MCTIRLLQVAIDLWLENGLFLFGVLFTLRAFGESLATLVAGPGSRVLFLLVGGHIPCATALEFPTNDMVDCGCERTIDNWEDTNKSQDQR